MAKALRRIYFDSCVFLSYLNNTDGRADTIEALLDESDQQKIQIWTSVLSISEVAFVALEKTNGDIGDEALAKIDELWLPPRVMLIEVHELMARNAQEIVRQSMFRHRNDQANNPILAGADSCHLAAADFVNTDEFMTYDKKILKANGFLRFPINKPSAIIQTRIDFPPSPS